MRLLSATIAGLWLAGLLLLPRGARAQAGDDAAARGLVDAYARGDFARIARIGRGESARGLAIGLADKRAVVVRAAIAAAPAAEDAWQLLGDLALLAARPDRQVGPLAARAAAEIAQSLDAARVAELEITPAELRERARAWAAVATDRGAWPDVRVHAVETSYLLARALAPKERATAAPDLIAMTEDPEPELRRAALELYPQPIDDKALARAAQVLEGDSDAVVALVAAQVACSGIAMGDEPRAILAAVGTAGLERVRDLIGNASMPIAARLDAAACLRASGTAADVTALKRLVATSPRFATKEAKRLLEALTP